GGSQTAWARVRQPLQDAAASYKGDPCCDWYGPGGAGHFIKMMHNGIEYADMQMIAEAYGILRDGAGLKAAAIGDVFAGWMDGPLNSYLVEIAAEVCRTKDPATGSAMLDIILDTAGQKGTGRWSVIEALHLGAPVSTMAAAVEARNVSAQKPARQAMEQTWGPPKITPLAVDAAALGQALLAAKIIAYDQGFGVLRRASETFDWALDLGAIARGWRAGCIIRSVLLDEISEAFDKGSPDLMSAPAMRPHLNGHVALRRTVGDALGHGLQAPALFAALAAFDGARTGLGTANMIQGLRDRFGAHGFERTDAPGKKVNGPWHS
ncbi:MAG: NADP-dependent phosphogluconate dehydrogenase, partial [Pseudomonadota bacterium]